MPLQDAKDRRPASRNPWLFVPTLSFTQGIPIIIVLQVTSILYKSLGVSNEVIGLTGLFMLPMSFKFLFGPIVDALGTKRRWVLLAQLLLCVCLGGVAVSLQLPAHIPVSMTALALLAVLCGLNDVPTDGFYLEALSEKQQASFIGVKVAGIRIAMVFATGFLVIMAGELGRRAASILLGWTVFFAIVAGIFLLSLLWHAWVLPFPHRQGPERAGSVGALARSYLQAFKAYIAQQDFLLVAVFILLFRGGEGLLAKMAIPFFMDPVEAGGLGLSVSSVGFMYGSVGVVSSILGGLLGGFLLKRGKFKPTIILLATCMTIPNILYVMLAHVQPSSSAVIDLSFLASVVGLDAQLQWVINVPAQLAIAGESFGYGMGYAAFLAYLCRISASSEYSASFFAISTGLQTLGWTLFCSLSGYIQAQLGYTWLFVLSILFALPGMMCLVILVSRTDRPKNKD